MSEEYVKVAASSDASEIELVDVEAKEISKDEIEEVSTEEIGTYAELFMYADKYDYMLMTAGSLGGLLTGFSIPAFNVIFGKMLDALNSDPGSFSRRINSISIIFVLVGVGNIGSGLLQVVCWSKAGERMSQKFREAYVTAILRQEIGWFDSNGSGELTTKVADLAGRMQDGLTRKVGDLFQYFGQFLAAFGVGLYLCWSLTVVLLAAFPLIGAAGAFMIKSISSAVNDVGENYAAAGGIATESIGAIRTVSALNSQVEVISRYRVFLLDAMQVGIGKGFNVGLGNGLVFGAAFCTYALGFWYGGKLVADDLDRQCNADVERCLTGGTILSVFFSVIMGSIALGQIVPPISAFFSAKASVKPMLKIIQRVPLIDGLSEKGVIKSDRSEGHIELSNVGFCYPSRPDIKVCQDYSLSIMAGETVALVGASGCGKSTIINLLLRFYDPQSGSIKLDGTNIKDLNIKWLRSQLGYVGQEPILFSGSIEDNIGYGLDEDIHPRDDTYLEKVKEAAKLANAYDFIQELPEKFKTDVGSGGVAMSGGQKQRIAIARALIKKPSVLLLDEATSALDATSERLVQESIDQLQKSKSQTTLVIAHRLSTIRNADKICVIDGGKIVEMGTHDELILKPDGHYADLVSLQMTNNATTEANVVSKALGAAVKEHGKEVVESQEEEKLIASEDVSIIAAYKAQVMSKVWRLVKEHPFWLGAALFGGACFGAMFPCWGLMLAKTQTMFYYTDTDKLRDESISLSMWYLLLAFIAISSSVLQFGGSAQVGERVSMKLRSSFFEAIMRREISFFDNEKHATGILTTQLSDDSRAVSKATGENVPRLIQAFFTLVVGLGLGFSANAKLAAVVIAVFPVSIAASAIQMQAIAGQQYDQINTNNNAGGLISSAFTNMRTVSAFSMQFKVADEYNRMTRAESDDRSKRSWITGLGFGMAQGSMMWTYALLFWYGSQLIEKGEISFEDMMIAILSLMLGALGLGQAVSGLGDQKEGLIAAKRIFNAIEEASNSTCDGLSTIGIVPEQRSAGKIELRNVSFRYPTRLGVEVCKNFNLVVYPGEVVALVGPSGSGKSTIMNLLLRFYEPESGMLLLDDVPLNTINVRWLRSQLGYVGQEPVLFTGSVGDNIARGLAEYDTTKLLSLEEALKSSDDLQKKGVTAASANSGTSENCSTDDIIKAARASNAHDFIEKFTEGYNTDIGEASLMVSGGQKQRIAIARALIKKPSVLLLDEATSALDATSERLVQESIDQLQKSKSQTTLVIAHRLSTIRNADKICVIDKGEIVQVGTHDQLVQNENGLYYTLWTKQSGKGKRANC